MAQLPLSGIAIVDMSRVLAGPLGAMTLADMGADVIKVENPDGGDDTRRWGIAIAPGETSYYFSFNRNKRSLRLDLATAEGCEEALSLCAKADVVIENFKLGGMEKFGLGNDQLKLLNPGLIFCSISGYDRYSAEAARYDLVIQGESGLMGLNGEAGRPPLKFGVAVVDLFTGMAASQAILAALFQRTKTGTGRRIDLALYDCGVMISSYYGMETLMQGKDPPSYGNAHPSIVPYGVFDAADGALVICVGNNRQFRSLCNEVLDRPDIADDPRYGSNILRSSNREALLATLDEAFRQRSRESLLKGLAEQGVPCGEVLGPHDALTRERTKDAGLIADRDHPSGVSLPLFAPPWRFDGERLPVAAAAINEAVGLKEELLSATVDYLKTRRQFGVPIGSFQALQHKTVDMFIEVEQAKSMALFATASLGLASPAKGDAIAAAKLHVNHASKFVAEMALQLHGAIGMTQESKVGRMFQRLTAFQVAFGNIDHWLSSLVSSDARILED